MKSHVSQSAQEEIQAFRELDRQRGHRRGIRRILYRITSMVRGTLHLASYWFQVRVLGKTVLKVPDVFHDVYCQPLNNPRVAPAATATHMRDSDDILGLAWKGETRAYPWWIMDNHHVANDTVSGDPVVLTLCERCFSGNAFLATRDGIRHTFDHRYMFRGTIAIRDYETETVWGPNSGVAVEGPLAGKTLTRVPLYQTTWGEWRSLHPDTSVVLADESLRFGHGSDWFPGRPGGPGQWFKMTIGRLDRRLPEHELCLGVTVKASHRAYPLARLSSAQGVVNDSLGGEPIAVFSSPHETLLAIAFSRRVGERILEFVRGEGPEFPILDRETGSVWNYEGKAISGPRAGSTLRFVDSHVGAWYTWAAYHPTTEIFSDREPEPSPAVERRRTPRSITGPWPWKSTGPSDDLLALLSPPTEPSRRVLELNCSNGALVRSLARRGHSVVGVSHSLTALTVAGEPEGPHCSLVVADPLRLPFRDLLFSYAFDRQAFSTLPPRETRQYIAELGRVVDHGGRVELISPSGEHRKRRSRIRALLRAIRVRGQDGLSASRLQWLLATQFKILGSESLSTADETGRPLRLRHLLLQKK